MEDRLGEERLMNCGLKAKIIRYGNSQDIDVKFEDGFISYNKSYRSFTLGRIGNKNIKKDSSLKLTNRLGEINYNKYGTKMEIIRYNNYDDIDIKFYDKDNTVIKNSRYKYFKNGNLPSPYDITVYEVGYLGIPYFLEEEKDIKISNLKSYKHWVDMLYRCYHKNIINKLPTYIDKEVCKEWFCYANFKQWFDVNYYEIDGQQMELDKDILLKGNKLYSPETCVFVPHNINMLFVKANKIRGDYPIGVQYDKTRNKFIATVTINNKKKFLGRFNSIEEAFFTYKTHKEEIIKNMAEEYKDRIPQKLYEAMYKYEVEIID